jgi:hypothetical protein
MNTGDGFETQKRNKTSLQSTFVPFIVGAGTGTLSYVMLEKTREKLIEKTKTASTAEQLDDYRQQITDHQSLPISIGFCFAAVAATYLAVKHGRSIVAVAKDNLRQIFSSNKATQSNLPQNRI